MPLNTNPNQGNKKIKTRLWSAMNARLFIYVMMVMTQVLGSVFGYGTVTLNDLFTIPVAQAAEGINRTINYQGRLMNTAGTNVDDGNYDIKFTIYDSALGGTQLWTASSTNGLPTGSIASISVSVEGGLFSILLGDTSDNQVAFPDDMFNSDSLYLGITIGTDAEMTPRKRLSSVPYAFNSETLQGQYASNTVANTGGDLFALHQNSTDAASATRTALYVETNGTDDENDLLINASNGSTDVFTINRQGNVTTTGNLEVDGITQLNNTLAVSATSSLADMSLSGRVDSNLLPYITDTYYLGNSTYRWLGLTVANVSSTNIDALNYVSTTNLYVGGVQVTGATPNLQQVTDVNNITTNPIGVAGVSSTGNILPTTSLTYDLGSTSRKWNDAYFGGDLYATGTVQGGTMRSYGNLRVDGTTTLNTVTYTWPAANAQGALVNDGSGNFSFNNNVGQFTNDAGYITGVGGQTLNSARIWVGNSSNQAADVLMSGDGTLSNTGVLDVSGLGVGDFATANVSQWTNDAGYLTSLGNAFVDGGNLFGATGDLGTNDAFALNFRTNNATKVTIDTTGNIYPASNTYNLGLASNRWGSAYLNGNLYATGTVQGGTMRSYGALQVDGATTLNGTVGLGNSTADTITATGYFGSSLIPSLDNTYSLGTSALRWKNIYAANVSSTNIDALNYVSTTNLYVDGVQVTGATPNLDQVTTEGNITSNAIGVGGVSSTGNILPTAPLTYDLGSSNYRWRDVWASSTRIGTSTWDIWQSNLGLTFSKNNLASRYLTITNSGTLLPGGNKTQDIGAAGAAWKDIYASGTVYGHDFSSTPDGGVMTVVTSSQMGTTGVPVGLQTAGGYAYMTGVDDKRFNVVDISHPTSPTIVGTLSLSSYEEVGTTVINGDYAYVSVVADWFSYHEDRLVVVDISSSTNPTFIAETVNIANSTNHSFDLYVKDQYVYFPDPQNDKLYVVDVLDPANPVVVQTLSVTKPWSITGSGNYVYTITGQTANQPITIFDISDPENVTVVGTFSTGLGIGEKPLDMQVLNGYLYIHTDESMQVMDITSPTNPVIRGHVATPNALVTVERKAQSMVVSHKYVYTVSNNGIVVVNVADPDNIFVDSQKTGMSNPFALAVEGGYAYTMDANRNLNVIYLGGVDTHGLNAYSALLNNVTVNGTSQLDDVAIGGKLTVGFEGIYNQGTLKNLGASRFYSTSTFADIALEGRVNSNLLPYITDNYYLGNSTYRWLGISAQNGTFTNVSSTNIDALGYVSTTNLYVNGTQITGAAPNLQQVSDAGATTTNWLQFAGGTSTDDFYFQGNVGVGTTAPEGLFHVKKDNGGYSSDQTGSGTATDSGHWVSFTPDKAFDNIDSFWNSPDFGGFPQWLEYDFGSGNDKVVNRYRILYKDNWSTSKKNPGDWLFQGSNNNTDWVTLDTRSGYTSWTFNTWKTFDFSNNTPYRYYRIYITANGAGNTLGVSINEMELIKYLDKDVLVDSEGNLSANASTTLKDLTLTGRVNSNLLPYITDNYYLGNSSYRWLGLNAVNVTTTNLAASYVTTSELWVDGTQITGATPNLDQVTTEGNITSNAIGVGGVSSTGNILPTASLTYDLGSTSRKWNDAYFGGDLYATGTIQGGSMRSYGNLRVDGTTTLNTVEYTWPGSDGSGVLRSDGTGGLSWDTNSYLTGVTGSSLANNKIWIGNGSNQATEVTMGGDATMSNTGEVTVVNDSHNHTGTTLSIPGTSLTDSRLWVGNGSGAAAEVLMSGDGTLSNAGVLDVSGLDTGDFTSANISQWTNNVGYVTSGTAFVQGGNSFTATAILGTNDSQNLQFETADSVKMTILTSGNVGINDTNPAERLVVGGNIRLQAGGDIDTSAAGTLTFGGTTQTGLTMGRIGAATNLRGSNFTNGGLAYGASNQLTFTSAGTAGMAVISGGAGAPTFGTLGLTYGGTNANLSGVATGGILYKGATAIAGTGALTGVLKGNGSGAPSAMTGTANRVTYWSDANTLGTSNLVLSGNNVYPNAAGSLGLTGNRFSNAYLSGNVYATGTIQGGSMRSYGNLRVDGTTTLNTVEYTWPGSDGSGVLRSDGTGGLSWDTNSYLTGVTGSSLANNKIWIGNGSNQATEVTMGGDATMSNTGEVTVVNDSHNHTGTTLSIPGTSLTDSRLWVGNGSGAAAEVLMSGDGTLSNAGVLDVSGLDTGDFTTANISQWTNNVGYVTSGTAFVQNGNIFGATAVLGTNDAHNLTFETEGTTRTVLDTSGHFYPNTNYTQDLGLTGSRWNNVWGATFHVGTSTWDMTQLADGSFDVNQASTSLNLSRGVSGDDASLAVKSATIGGAFLRLADEDDNDFAYFAGDSSVVRLRSVRDDVDLIFGTTNKDRLVLESDGDLRPNTSNTFDLGTSSYLWSNAFFSGALRVDGDTIFNSHTYTWPGVSANGILRNTGGALSWDDATYLTASDAFIQNGNSFGTAAVLGTNDTQNLTFETHDITRAILDTSGNFYPNTNYSQDLGLTTNRWDDIWGATVHVGTSTWDIAQSPAGDFTVAKNGRNYINIWDNYDNLLFGQRSGLHLTTGQRNVGYGTYTLVGNETGSDNTAIGDSALANDGSNDSYSYNTAVGSNSMGNINTGSYNSALGAESLYGLTTGASNTAVGFQSLYSNSEGFYNTALGVQTLRANTTGILNTAIGAGVLLSNEDGGHNVGIGPGVLYNNVSGDFNIGIGDGVLFNNTASNNIGLGQDTLNNNISGTENIGIGTEALKTNSDGSYNIAIGNLALNLDVSGGGNVAIGHQALRRALGNDLIGIGDSALINNTTGLYNTATGKSSLATNQTGNYNSAYGHHSLFGSAINSYSQNSAFGSNAMEDITTGSDNSSFGASSLRSITSGASNTAVGFESLYSNNTGSYNTSIGSQALRSNTAGTVNTAIGSLSLFSNEDGSNNVALGPGALYGNISGDNNIGIGDSTLFNNTASDNIGIGHNALLNNISGDFNTGIGHEALAYNTVSNNTALGYQAGFYSQTGIDNIAIGNYAMKGTAAYTGSYRNTAVGFGSLFRISSNANDNTALGYNTLPYLTTGDLNIAVGGYAIGALMTGRGNIAVGYSTLGETTTGVYNTAIGNYALNGDGNGGDYNYNTAVGGYSMYGISSGIHNTAVGYSSLSYPLDGSYNTAIGDYSLTQSTGASNTAVGFESLYSNSNGWYNTAVGLESLHANESGYGNEALGATALYSNQTGSGNIGIGVGTLYSNTAGFSNIAIGGSALYNNTASGNLAIGINALNHNTSGSDNVAIGSVAISGNQTGHDNTAVGSYALYGNSFTNSHSYNTAIGAWSMYSITSGTSNTAVGFESLKSNDTGYLNTANGTQSLWSNTTGNWNTALGAYAMRANTTGGQNTAIGPGSLMGNITGNYNTGLGGGTVAWNAGGQFNTGVGFEALNGDEGNSNFSYNTALGSYSLNNLTTGASNTAVGYNSLFSNNGGAANVAMGVGSLENNVGGYYNTAIGYHAMYFGATGTLNVAIGSDALTQNVTSSNVAIGAYSQTYGTTGSNNVSVGTFTGALNRFGSFNTWVGDRAGAGSSITSNSYNTGIGAAVLQSITSGASNTAMGYNSLFNNATGSQNVAIGANSLFNNEASFNIALGDSSAYNNISGSGNIAIGNNALWGNVYGNENTAVGILSQYTNEGEGNTSLGAYALMGGVRDYDRSTAVGAYALFNNESNDNTALGFEALYETDTGNGNVAVGKGALYENTSGYYNFAGGMESLGTDLYGYNNIGVGYRAGYNNDAGHDNVFLGRNAGYGDSTASAVNYNVGIGSYVFEGITTGDSNVAIGYYSSHGVTTGGNNVSIGNNAANDLTSGDYNTLIGSYAGYFNEGADYNVAVGYHALYGSNGTTNAYNTAVGTYALDHVAGGATYNTALGYHAGSAITTGDWNVAIGYNALDSLQTGGHNVAIGQSALSLQTTGVENLAIGSGAGSALTSGSKNIFIGNNAGDLVDSGQYNTFVGWHAGNSYVTSGDNNTLLGYGTDVSGSNVSNAMALGYYAVVGSSNTIQFGNNQITAAYFGTSANSVTVTTWGSFSELSDSRLKSDISENKLGLNFINLLEPIHYTMTSSSAREDGLIAQDVEAAALSIGEEFNGVVPPDESFEYYRLSYGSFVGPLINAVQELYASSSPMWDGISIDPIFAGYEESFMQVDADGNIATRGVTIAKQAVATTSTPAVDSYTFSYNGSAWNASTSQEITTSFRMFNNTISATSSELKYVYTTGTGFTQDLLTITNLGDMHVSGDLHVGRRLYLGSKTTGEGSTSTYIFVDDTLSPTSTYIATNADGWQTETTYDYAERYESNEELMPGDLVTADPNGINLVKRATSPSEPLLGIVSTKPGFVTGRHYDGWYPIALAGRVPTRVSTVNGAIKVGDYITASGVNGVGVKAIGPGNVIGVALEAYDSPEEGLISVFVKPTYTAGTIIASAGASAGNVVINQTVTVPEERVEIEGLAVINYGQTEVHISYGSLLAYPMVYATPHASIDGSWWVDNRTDSGFDIILSEPQGHDVEFTWMARPMQRGTVRFISDNTYENVDDLTGNAIGPVPSETIEDDTATTTADVPDTSTTTQDIIEPEAPPADDGQTATSTTEITNINTTDVSASSTEPVALEDATASSTQTNM